MTNHRINGFELTDWNSFHDTFAKEFVFPDYYGRNMNAWVDCMSDLGEDGEIISIIVDNVSILEKNNLDIYEALVERSAFVNYRFTNEGSKPVIALSYHE